MNVNGCKGSKKEFFTKTWLHQTLLLTLCILVFGIYSLHLGEDINWDLLDYHFYNGFAFLHHRIGWDIAPAMVQSYINPFFEIFNYVLISSQRAAVAIFILGAISGIAVFFLYKISVILLSHLPPFKRTLYSFYAVIIGATGSAGLGMVGMTTNDNKMALLIMIGFYFLIKAVMASSRKSKISYVVISGIIIGMTVGFKLVAAPYAIGAFAGLTFSRSWCREHILICSALAMSLFVGFLLSDGYWMYFIYQHFQSPLFPYYNNIFHSPYVEFGTFKDPKFFPQHYLTFPFYMVVHKSTLLSDAPIRDARLAVLYILAVLALLKYGYQKLVYIKAYNDHKKLCPKDQLRRLVVIFYLVSLAVWFLQFTIYRYTIPLELLSGLFIVCLVRKLFHFEAISQAVILILIGVFLVTTVYPCWGRIKYGKEYFSISGIPFLPKNSVVLFLSAPFAYQIPYFPDAVHFVGLPFITTFKDQFPHNAFELAYIIPHLPDVLQIINAPFIHALANQPYGSIPKLAQSIPHYSIDTHPVRARYTTSFINRSSKNVFELTYLIRYYQTIDTWLIDKNFISLTVTLGKENVFEKETFQLIQKNPKHLYTLTFQGPLNYQENRLLNYYGLTQDKMRCKILKSNVSAPLELCPVKLVY